MPYKDPEVARVKSAERQRKYHKKPGINEAYAARMRKLREDPSYVAGERAQQKISRANPDTRPERLERDRTRKAKRRQFFNLLKMERGCYDCGGLFPPEALDWDHMPGTVKSFNIGTEVSCHPIDEVIAEIAKCQLVCATCHRIRTINRRGEGE